MARIVDNVKCWENKKGTVVTVIPKKIRKQLGIESGTILHVSSDKKGRLIFTKIGER